ncbi:MAG: hypothetical protein KAU14_06240, partial [Thermoplasmata archaeon]|nr:hypothetical protein [Thermoplasmata archaeon]
KHVGNGRVDFWFESDKVIVIDITRSTTKKTVKEKWRRRDYHTDPRIDEVWIVINSDAFSEKDYADFRRDAPENVEIYHITEIFDMFGEPPRELKLELQKYEIIGFYDKEEVEKLYQEALAEGRDYLIERKEHQAKLGEWLEAQEGK